MILNKQNFKSLNILTTTYFNENKMFSIPILRSSTNETFNFLQTYKGQNQELNKSPADDLAITIDKTPRLE